MPKFVKFKHRNGYPVYVNVNAIRTIRECAGTEFHGTRMEMPENEIMVYGSPEECLHAIEAAESHAGL